MTTDPGQDEIDSPPTEIGWAVWRQGNDGNAIMVKDGLSHEEAQQLVAQYEAKGHKQNYLVVKSR